MNSHSSNGPDNVSFILFQCFVTNAQDLILKLFNLFISNGFVPIDWKIGAVTPIYKGTRNVADVCSYKFITVTSHFS